MVTNVFMVKKFFSCSLWPQRKCRNAYALVSHRGKAPYDTCMLPESYERQVLSTPWQTGQLQHPLETAGHFPHRYKERTFLKELVGRKITKKPCVHIPTSILCKVKDSTMKKLCIWIRSIQKRTGGKKYLTYSIHWDTLSLKATGEDF